MWRHFQTFPITCHNVVAKAKKFIELDRNLQVCPVLCFTFEYYFFFVEFVVDFISDEMWIRQMWLVAKHVFRGARILMSIQGSERHLYLTVLEISKRNKSQSNAVTSKM